MMAGSVSGMELVTSPEYEQWKATQLTSLDGLPSPPVSSRH